MQDSWDNRQVGHLGVVCMSLVDRVCLPFAYVHRKGFAAVWNVWIIRSAMVLDEIFKKWIWTSGIVGGIRHRKNVFV